MLCNVYRSQIGNRLHGLSKQDCFDSKSFLGILRSSSNLEMTEDKYLENGTR